MNNKTIPALLAVTVMIAGIFAFMPVEQASTVHTTIQETGTNYVEVTATGTVNDDDFLITCPTTSDACRIQEIFLDDDTTNDTIDPGNAVLAIDGEAAFVSAADTGAAAQQNTVVALTGVSGTTLGPGDTMRIEVTSSGTEFDYTLRVLAEVESNETITVARVAE